MIMNPTIRLPECICRESLNQKHSLPAVKIIMHLYKELTIFLITGNPHLGDVKPSIGPNYEFSNLNEILPEYVSTSMAQGIVKMGRMLHGFDDGDAVLTGVESRSSSPVRIMRKTDTLESVLIEGLYPCGEGAGYAGGIISAAVDGIKCAEKL